MVFLLEGITGLSIQKQIISFFFSQPEILIAIATTEKSYTDATITLEFSFYVPNFEEVEGAYWFGPVRPSVRLSVRNTFLAA